MNTFINEFRPRRFSDYDKDEHILFILKTLMEIDQLNIILVGGQDSGKTVLLDTIVEEYYGGKDDNILYINSLKEQGIQYFRTEVKSFCQTSSTIDGKKKMIVIDDLDTMNSQTQQSFRNYIDKYNHNVNFIMSCTSIYKVIDSIQSRIHVLKLTTPTPDVLYRIMNRIVERKRISISDASKEFIVNISNHSIRVLIHHLEKLYLLGESDEDSVQTCCTHINYKLFDEYTLLMKKGCLKEAIMFILEIYNLGYSVMDIIYNYFLFVKNTANLDEKTKYDAIPIICKYISIPYEDENELAFFTNNMMEVFFLSGK